MMLDGIAGTAVLLLMFAVVAAAIYGRLTVHRLLPKKQCRRCGTVAAPKHHMPGSFVIEVVLWMCFIIPGIIYSAWRHSRVHDRCSACGSPDIIPVNSPAAQALQAQ